MFKKMAAAALAALALIASGGDSTSASNEEGKRASISWATGVNSRYLGKAHFFLHEEPVWTNNLNAAFPSGLYMNAWSSIGLDDTWGDFGEELDLTLGSHSKVSDVGELDVSTSYFFIAKTGLNDLDDDLVVFDGRFDFTKTSYVRPWVALRYFDGFAENSPPSGWYGWIGVERNQPLGCKFPWQSNDLALNIDAQLAFSQGGPLGAENGFLYSRLGVSLPVSLGGTELVVVPSVRWQTPWGSSDDEGVVFGVLFKRQF